MKRAVAEVGLTVGTMAGPVRGRLLGGVRTWRGIPFAQAPEGGLRFRSPVPVAPWTRTRDAFEFGDAPPQNSGFIAFGRARHPASEDCLSLNVSAPADLSGAPLPVIVCFAGGGFTMGSPATPLYAGDRIAREGEVVYVSPNYRVGGLGFLDVTRYANARHPFEANVGLRDQIAALEWVRDNIEAFGGDPGNVTIFGQSAGATSVVTLMAVPSAQGLFHRAFALSPFPGSVYARERHAGWARDLVGILGLDSSQAADALVALRWPKLIDAMYRLTRRLGPANDPGTLVCSPVVDGDLLPSYPVDAFRDGTAHRVPLVVGTTVKEGALFRFMNLLPTTPARMERMFERADPDARARVLAGYPDYPAGGTLVDLAGDAIFWHPTTQVAEGHSRHAPVWNYRYDFETPMLRRIGLAGGHGTDVPALFGNFDADAGRFFTMTGGRDAAHHLGLRYQGALLSFALTGDPGADWPRFDERDRRVRVFDTEDRVEEDPWRTRRLAWGDYRGYY